MSRIVAVVLAALCIFLISNSLWENRANRPKGETLEADTSTSTSLRIVDSVPFDHFPDTGIYWCLTDTTTFEPGPVTAYGEDAGVPDTVVLSGYKYARVKTEPKKAITQPVRSHSHKKIKCP